MSAVTLDVEADSKLWDAFPDAAALARRTLAAAMAEVAPVLHPGAQVSLLLTDDAHMRALNRQWRGQNKPTNVLSFPTVPADRLAAAMALGDIAIAFETLAREAREEHLPLADHFAHLVLHGFLHLLGHDHDEAQAAARMEAVEVAVLALLGIADPYAGRPLDLDPATARMASQP